MITMKYKIDKKYNTCLEYIYIVANIVKRLVKSSIVKST